MTGRLNMLSAAGSTVGSIIGVSRIARAAGATATVSSCVAGTCVKDAGWARILGPVRVKIRKRLH